MDNMTYASTGVNYAVMDPHKRESLQAAEETNVWAKQFGFAVVPWTRGESVTLIETPWGYLGLVVEGLGTKNLAADIMCQELCKVAAEMEHLQGKSFYDQVGQCNAAMAFNDLITLGVRPLMYGQYLAVGNDEWFKNDGRRRDLIKGTKHACDLARCVWGGGETPTLKGIIVPGTVDLAGATMGIIPNKKQLIDPASIEDGDAIVIIESSGIHANGLTLARQIAGKLPQGYFTKLGSGSTYGEALLEPTLIYVDVVEDCLDAGVKIKYGVNITGHGWRKLMRPTQPFTYVINTLPTPLPIFDCIQEHGPVDDKEAYGNLNMGAGFALYVGWDQTDLVIQTAHRLGKRAFVAGRIENGEKKVIIKPKNLEYAGDTLAVR